MAVRPIPLSRVLTRSKVVKDLLSQAQQHRTLLTDIQKHLPPPMGNHCHSALMQNRHLLLFVDSSAWASKFRYFSRNLKNQLRKAGIPVSKLSIRVMVNDTPQPSKRPVYRKLSQENAVLIDQIAETIGDKDLSAALKRLGRHGLKPRP
ncbi:MAG: DUF721 domain-containing protein [Gammaproteobacteria bacterium]|nr:DUF721 domain-containing protein [Gammaproteobacteria bacterium]